MTIRTYLNLEILTGRLIKAEFGLIATNGVSWLVLPRPLALSRLMELILSDPAVAHDMSLYKNCELKLLTFFSGVDLSR